MEETLEPIHSIDETPYGEIIIGKDVLCTPTSLCTWEDSRPVVYCKQPQHTLNPICKTVNKGIGLLGCYKEATCGGNIPTFLSEQILEQNPHYRTILQKEEQKVRNPSPPKDKMSIFILGMVPVVLFLIMCMIYYFSQHKKLKEWWRHKLIKHVLRKKSTSITQNPKRSTFRKISSGAVKTGKP